MIESKYSIDEIDLPFKSKEDFIINGEKLFHKYCSSDKHLPLFFPDITDKLTDYRLFRGNMYEKDETKSNKIIYKALKTLQQPVMVFYGINFSHNQFHMWDPNYDPEKCAKVEATPNCSIEHGSKIVGEMDFLIVGPKYIVVIDVHSRTASDDSVESKISKQQTSIQLMDQIGKTAPLSGNHSRNSDQYKVFQFCFFPPRDENNALEILVKLTIDGQAKEVQSITDADCLDLNPWWERNLNSGKVNSGDIDLIQKTMLALFSLSRKDNPDQQTLTDTASKQAADSKKQTDKGKQKQKPKPIQRDTANNPAMYQSTETDAKDTANNPAMYQSTETDAQKDLKSFSDFLKPSGLGTLITPFVRAAFGSEISDSIQTDKILTRLKSFFAEEIPQIFFPSIPSKKEKMQNKNDYLSIGDNVGDDVFRSFSLFFQHDSFPQMLPVCPNQSYIDLYPAEDQSSQTLIDIKKQQDRNSRFEVLALPVQDVGIQS